MNTDASDDYTRSFFTAFWQARHAADAKSREDHVWQLELALEALCSIVRPEEITPRERDGLHDNLRDARLASERMLADCYPPEQIAYGYRAAHAVVTAWALPVEQRHALDPIDASRPVLVCFRADIGNMRRMDALWARTPRVALDDLLPPLPRMPGSDEGATILSFLEF